MKFVNASYLIEFELNYLTQKEYNIYINYELLLTSKYSTE